MTSTNYVQTVLAERFKPVETRLHKTEAAAFLATAIMNVLDTGVKVDSMIGGSASGKTTMAQEIAAAMQQNGQQAAILSTDNYAKGDREYRHVTLKGADAKAKYDLELFDKHVARIRNLQPGQVVRVPTLNKETGIAADADEADYTDEISRVDALIIDGDLPLDGYDVQTYMHVPDEKRLQNYIRRSLAYKSTLDPDQLTTGFNTWQSTTYLPYTLPALETSDYVITSDAEGDDWEYAIYERQAVQL